MAVLLVSMDLFALATVPAGPDEAGGPPPTSSTNYGTTSDDVLKYEATRVLNEHLLSPDIFKERARALAHVQPPLDIELAIVGAREPRQWSGSRVPHWTRLRDDFREWANDPDEQLAALGRAGVAKYDSRLSRGDPHDF